VVRKKDGRKMLSAIWELSPDGNTLTDNYTEFDGDKPRSTVKYLYQRTAAGSGFGGTWESIMPAEPAFVLQIRPYGENGLSLTRGSAVVRKLNFDGKDYPLEGARIEGLTSSSRRVDERTVEITDKINGKTLRTERIELSPDLKILTRTLRPVSRSEPDVFVFERQ
jgi:hypothetical protein